MQHEITKEALAIIRANAINFQDTSKPSTNPNKVLVELSEDVVEELHELSFDFESLSDTIIRVLSKRQ